MKLQKRLSALVLSVLLLGGMCVNVRAHDVPDISRKGSISVEMTYEDQPVPGGAFLLYRVGGIREDDGDYSFALTEKFAGSGADLTDITSASLAERLAKYAESQKISGIGTKEIGENGKVAFADLELGLYLLVQTQASDGYNKAAPFLVSLPMRENGEYLYAVEASPKVELTKAPAPETPTPEMPPAEPTLPQTGQLNWPIPVLAVLGLGIFAAGYLLRFGGRRGSYAK